MRCPNCASERLSEQSISNMGQNMNLRKKICFDCSLEHFSIESFIFRNLEMKKDSTVQEILDYLDWNWNQRKNPQANWPVDYKTFEEIKFSSRDFGRKMLKYRKLEHNIEENQKD